MDVLAFHQQGHSSCRLFLLLIASAIYCSAVYVFHGNPYSFTDPLLSASHTLRQGHDGLPYHTMVFYPTESGTYPVVFFVGGLNGVVPVEAYTDVLQRIAAHGLIVTGVDTELPVLKKTSFSHQEPSAKSDNGFHDIHERHSSLTDLSKVVATFEWLREHLNSEIATLVPSNTSVVADWSIIGGMCHSAGCEPILEMVTEYMNTVNFSAVVWLEPFCAKAPFLPSPVPGSRSLPSLMHGTQWCEMKPNCCLRGFDYISLYGKWQCPRILINVTDFGHCDILNDLPYEGCHLSHFCKTGENNRTLYRDYMQGLVSAFFSSTLQDNWNEMIKYVIQPSLIPVPLGNLTYDIGCHNEH